MFYRCLLLLFYQALFPLFPHTLYEAHLTRQTMNFDENPTKVYRIVKYSLFLFSIAFFLFAGNKLLNDTIPTAGSTKKLPIYCVDTEEKKVSLSFDAA